MLFALHARLGIEHCVMRRKLNCHGTDNSVTEDAVATTGGAYKGVALVSTTIADTELKRLAAAGLTGAHFPFRWSISAPARRLMKPLHLANALPTSAGICKFTWTAIRFAELAPALRAVAELPVVG